MKRSRHSTDLTVFEGHQVGTERPFELVGFQWSIRYHLKICPELHELPILGEMFDTANIYGIFLKDFPGNKLAPNVRVGNVVTSTWWFKFQSFKLMGNFLLHFRRVCHHLVDFELISSYDVPWKLGEDEPHFWLSMFEMARVISTTVVENFWYELLARRNDRH